MNASDCSSPRLQIIPLSIFGPLIPAQTQEDVTQPKSHRNSAITSVIHSTTMPRKDPLHVYSTDPDWSDIDPIPQDDGGPDGLAVIAYADEYREVSSYLRAVMAGNERSERVLKLTSHLIELNPAHYTVW